MGSQGRPLVSVLTPVYNGAEYLTECIESVMAQTYDNWEYIIVDNHSDDETGEIADAYARRDQRIRVHHNQQLLPVLQNWNHCLRQISPDSKYCKFVHADDQLLPHCVSEMVELAEEHPTVGIVSAFRIRGSRMEPHRMLFASRAVSGRDVCRASLLLGAPDVFGSPTSLLMRSSVVRSRDSFYNEANLHADTEVCFDILREHDFGFVHQPLTYTRVHEGSITHAHKDFSTYKLGRYHILHKYGPEYLTPPEYHKRLRNKQYQYYFFLSRAVLGRRGKDIWRYHASALESLGYKISIPKMFGAFLAGALLHPKGLVGVLIAEMRKMNRNRRRKKYSPDLG